MGPGCTWACQYTHAWELVSVSSGVRIRVGVRARVSVSVRLALYYRDQARWRIILMKIDPGS